MRLGIDRRGTPPRTGLSGWGWVLALALPCAFSQTPSNPRPSLKGTDPVGTPATVHQGPAIGLGGILGNKALLVINGATPRSLSAGESWQGVRVLSVGRDHAVVEVEGHRNTLRIGEAPLGQLSATSTESSAGQRIVLQAGTGGHYYGSGQINGRYVEFMVDSGATTVSMGAAQATALGIKYQSGQRARAHTANGIVSVYLVNLETVRIGPVTLRNVEGSVAEAPMTKILLGNSFLSRFDIQQNGGQMVLEKRY